MPWAHTVQANTMNLNEISLYWVVQIKKTAENEWVNDDRIVILGELPIL